MTAIEKRILKDYGLSRTKNGLSGAGDRISREASGLMNQREKGSAGRFFKKLGEFVERNARELKEIGLYDSLNLAYLGLMKVVDKAKRVNDPRLLDGLHEELLGDKKKDSVSLCIEKALKAWLDKGN